MEKINVGFLMLIYNIYTLITFLIFKDVIKATTTQTECSQKTLVGYGTVTNNIAEYETKFRSSLDQPAASPQIEFLALENSFLDVLNSTLKELNSHVTLVNTELTT